MSKNYDEEELLEQDIDMQAQEETNLYEQQEDIIENQEKEIKKDESEITKLRDMLARSAADLENFKKRTERDKSDMVFFLKLDIFKNILPRIDDLERIIQNTPKDLQNGPVYEWIVTLQKTFSKDLDKLWVKSFESKGQQVDPERHEVMTQVPWEEWIIIDEFEKWYILWERVLRVAKVVVWNWS